MFLLKQKKTLYTCKRITIDIKNLRGSIDAYIGSFLYYPDEMLLNTTCMFHEYFCFSNFALFSYYNGLRNTATFVKVHL